MDQNQKKPLSAEELAAVDKAMAKFANTPQKRKKSAVREPVLQIPTLVRNLLIAAVLLILTVTLLVLVLGGGTEEPSPTPSETTLPSEMNETLTDGTEQPTEVPVPPDTQPIDPTESTPPYVPPTEPPTGPPTEPPTEPSTEPLPEPPVDVPEGTPVSSEELAHLQSLFHRYSVYSSMSRYRFTDPTTIGLQALTAADIRPDADITLTEQEGNYLAGISDAYLYLDVCILPKYEAEAILQQYYGLRLEDVPSAKDAVFWARTNCYYFIEEAYADDLNVTHAVTLPGGNIWVRYVDNFSGRIGQMVLSQTGEYHILSNTYSYPDN